MGYIYLDNGVPTYLNLLVLCGTVMRFELQVPVAHFVYCNAAPQCREYKFQVVNKRSAVKAVTYESTFVIG